MDDEKSVAPPAPEPLRRNLLVGATFAIGATIAAALGLPALLYLFSSPKSRKPSDWTEAGDISTLPPNAPVEIAFHQKRVDGWKVVSEKTTAWVVKHPDQRRHGFRPAMHPSGLRLPLGRNAERDFCAPVTLPCFPSTARSSPAPRRGRSTATRLRSATGKLFIGRLRPSAETQA